MESEIDDLYESLSSFDMLFTAHPKFDFINPKLDLEINTDNFIKWLESEDEYVAYGETYKEKVGSMCEYSCLYLAMKFRLSKLKGELRLVPGKFGFWEHWWCEYTVDGKVYIIDLTLRQFINDAPKLSILEATYSKNGYCIDEHVDYSYNLKEYCDEKRAFMFYNHPLKFEKK